jgi:hypothetical protein
MTEISQAWARFGVSAGPEQVEAILAEKDTILMVDGLDEAPGSVVSSLIEGLCNFAESYPSSRVVLTSRPTTALDAVENSSYSWAVYELQPWSTRQIDQFADTYLAALREDSNDISWMRLRPTVLAQSGLQELLSIPLMAQFVLSSALILGHAPASRVALLAASVDLFVSSWDLSKGTPKLSIPADLEKRLLGDIALDAILEERSWRRLSVPWMATRIVEHTDFPPQHLIEFWHGRATLLQEVEPDFFAFAFRSLAEYLAAQAAIRRWFPDLGVLAKFVVENAGGVNSGVAELIILELDQRPRSLRPLLSAIVQVATEDEENDRAINTCRLLITLSSSERSPQVFRLAAASILTAVGHEGEEWTALERLIDSRSLDVK